MPHSGRRAPNAAASAPVGDGPSLESPTVIGSVGDIVFLLSSFLRHLRARSLSPKMIEAYRGRPP
jgi:hypothetical protein